MAVPVWNCDVTHAKREPVPRSSIWWGPHAFGTPCLALRHELRPAYPDCFVQYRQCAGRCPASRLVSRKTWTGIRVI